LKYNIFINAIIKDNNFFSISIHISFTQKLYSLFYLSVLNGNSSENAEYPSTQKYHQISKNISYVYAKTIGMFKIEYINI